MKLSREKRLALLVLLAVLAVNAIGLWPETSITRVDINDNVSHLNLIQGMVEAVEHGRNPLDFWSPEGIFGYPEIRVYQPLAHGLVALLYFALGKTVSLMTVFIWVRYLSVLLLPASFFAAALLMELPPLTAAAAAVLAPLISTNSLYGVEYYSFVWRGFGLFPQAVATHLLLLTLGFGYRAVRQGRSVVLTGALLGLTALSHLIYGYMGALTLCLLALIPDAEVPRPVRLLRTLWVGLISALLSLFQLLPLLLDRAIMNHSNTEPVWKWDSWGAAKVLAWLFKGDLLDYGRLPVLSLLALGGIAVIVWDARRAWRMSPVRALVLSGTALWILLFFGRPFWGPLLLLAGVSPDMHLHRVIGGVHIFLVLMAAIGLAAFCSEIARRWNWVAAVLAAALALLPAVLERGAYLSLSAAEGERNLSYYNNQGRTLDSVIASLRERGGRTYAGLWTNWGKVFGFGSVPVYFVLAANRIPAVSYLSHTLGLPADLMGGFDELKPAHFRLFNVRSVLTPAFLKQSVPKFLVPRLEAGALVVFDAPGESVFDVVDAPVVVPTDKQSFFRINEPWLRSAWPENKEHLWLDFFGGAPAGLPHLPPDGKLPPLSFPPADPGRILNERQEDDVYQAELEATRPSFVLFKMTWHPNWKVLVDGKPVKTVMLSPGFIGAPVPVGRHQIWCRYEPGNWKLPVALAGLFAVLLLAAAERRGYLPGAQREVEAEATPAGAPTGPPAPVRGAGTKARAGRKPAPLRSRRSSE